MLLTKMFESNVKITTGVPHTPATTFFFFILIYLFLPLNNLKIILKFCQFYTISKTRLVITEAIFLMPQYVIHKPKPHSHD